MVGPGRSGLPSPPATGMLCRGEKPPAGPRGDGGGDSEQKLKPTSNSGEGAPGPPRESHVGRRAVAGAELPSVPRREVVLLHLLSQGFGSGIFHPPPSLFSLSACSLSPLLSLPLPSCYFKKHPKSQHFPCPPPLPQKRILLPSIILKNKRKRKKKNKRRLRRGGEQPLHRDLGPGGRGEKRRGN